MLFLCAGNLGIAIPIGMGGESSPSQFCFGLPFGVGGARD